MTRKTLELSDYDDIVRMLYRLMSKCHDVDLEYDIGLIMDKLEQSK